MDKDQYYVQTLRTLYLHGILLPLDLFIAKRSALKRASQWSLKKMITLSSSWDISDLVSGDLVITDWSADNLVNTDHFEMFLVPLGRSFLRAFSGHLDHRNWSSIPGVMVQMKFVTLLIHILYLFLFIKSHTSFELFPLICLLISFNKMKRKEKKRKININNDLAIWLCHDIY